MVPSINTPCTFWRNTRTRPWHCSYFILLKSSISRRLSSHLRKTNNSFSTELKWLKLLICVCLLTSPSTWPFNCTTTMTIPARPSPPHRSTTPINYLHFNITQFLTIVIFTISRDGATYFPTSLISLQSRRFQERKNVDTCFPAARVWAVPNVGVTYFGN